MAFFINNNTDIVLITLFLNLNEVSVYAVYMLVINGMKSVILSVSTGFQSLIGRELASQNNEKLYKIFKKYFYTIFMLSSIGFGTVIVLVRQFVLTYVGLNTDYEYDRVAFPVIIAISQMIICIREPFNMLIISANKFKETNRGAFIEAVSNVIISLILITKMGLIGVAIGTCVASVLRLLYFVIYLNKNIIYIKYRDTIKPTLFFVIYMIVVLHLYINMKNKVDLSWFAFIIKGGQAAIYNIMCIVLIAILVWHSNIRKIRDVFYKKK